MLQMRTTVSYLNMSYISLRWIKLKQCVEGKILFPDTCRWREEALESHSQVMAFPSLNLLTTIQGRAKSIP